MKTTEETGEAETISSGSEPKPSPSLQQPHPPRGEKENATSKAPSLRSSRHLTAPTNGAKKVVLPARERWFRAFTVVLRHVRTVNMFLPEEVMQRKSRENWALLRKYKGLPPENEENDNGDGSPVTHRVDMFSGFLPRIGADSTKPLTAPQDVVGFAFSQNEDPLPRCRQIFRKKLERRTKADINTLLDIMQRIHIFKKMTYDNQVETTKIMKLRDFDEGDVIVQHNSEYRYLCIILKGKIKFISRSMGVEIEVCTYRAWDCFGQHALSHPDPMNSMADIICTQDAVVLMVDKHDYTRHFSQLEEMQTQSRIHFFHSLGTFRDLEPHELRPLVKAFEHVRLPHNKVVCKEGSKRTHVYIIKCGECRMLKKFQLPDNPEPVFIELGSLRAKDCIYEPTFAFHWSEDDAESLVDFSASSNPNGDRGPVTKNRRGALVHDVSVVTTTFTELYMATLNDLKAIDTPRIAQAWTSLQQIHATRTAFTQQDLNVKFSEGQHWDNFKNKLVSNVITDKKLQRCRRGNNREKILLDDR
mmetsp:Transcript_12477/g.16121  ORF Transcript_12477/g.16121 Transcript_12477/m.16121 type:complete len:530 (+) Transcript_12477:115-1704(+)